MFLKHKYYAQLDRKKFHRIIFQDSRSKTLRGHCVYDCSEYELQYEFSSAWTIDDRFSAIVCPEILRIIRGIRE